MEGSWARSTWGFAQGPDVWRRNTAPYLKLGIGFAEPVVAWGQDLRGAEALDPEKWTLPTLRNCVLDSRPLCALPLTSLRYFVFPLCNIVRFASHWLSPIVWQVLFCCFCFVLMTLSLFSLSGKVIDDTVLNLLGIRHSFVKDLPNASFLMFSFSSLGSPLYQEPVTEQFDGPGHPTTTPSPEILVQLLLIRHLVTSLRKGISIVFGDRKWGKTTLGRTQLWLDYFLLWSSKDPLWGNNRHLSMEATLGLRFLCLYCRSCWMVGKRFGLQHWNW